MLSLPLIICVICLHRSSASDLFISSNDYKRLPSIYEMSDFQKCDIKNNNYCKVDIKLKPLDRNDSFWKLIMATKRNNLLFNHDEIYRTMCIPRTYENNSESMKDFITNIINTQVQEVKLISAIDKITCKEPYSFTTTDYLLMGFLIGYLCFIFVATFYDISGNRQKTSDNGFLLAFSIRRNYGKLFDRNKDTHYQHLKCIQGIRTLTSISVIWAHTGLSFMVSFVDNTNRMEDLQQQYFFRVICMSSFFLTQIFSLISSWLLTVQVFSIYEANNRFTLKDLLIVFMNRICRIWPALWFSVILTRKAVLNNFLDGSLTDLRDEFSSTCEKNWLRTVLFIQNNFYGDEVCQEAFWFIAADVQLYFLCLVILYLILKFKSTERMILQTCLILSYGLYAAIIYINNFDILPRIYPETAKWDKFSKDEKMVYLYKMAHSSLSTYILGICFGIFYFKQYRIADKQLNGTNWHLKLAVVLPVLAVIVSERQFSGVSAAIVGPSLKPVFIVGIGMGILNMIQSADGFFKKIFESRPLEFLSQFTYCVYIYHIFNALARTVMDKPLEVSHLFSTLAISCVQDTCGSFLLGFIAYLLFEMPWKHLQKMYLPQVKKRSVKVN